MAGPMFIVDFEPHYGEMVDVSPLLRRMVCRNPSKFTFHGTSTYVIGRGDVAVVDPGQLQFPTDKSRRNCASYFFRAVSNHHTTSVRDMYGRQHALRDCFSEAARAAERASATWAVARA